MRFLQIIEERTDENALESFSGPGRQSGGSSPWADDSIAMPPFYPNSVPSDDPVALDFIDMRQEKGRLPARQAFQTHATWWLRQAVSRGLAKPGSSHGE
jgi:hypothetical protein